MSCGSLSPSSAAAVFASRAEIPIRIAPVTSFNSAQRPVSSSSSSQRVSCFGSSVLPSVRSVVTTSVRVGGGGLLWPSTVRSPPPTRTARGGEGSGGGGMSAGNPASVFAAPAPPPPPPPPPPAGGGGGLAPPPSPPPHAPRGGGGGVGGGGPVRRNPGFSFRGAAPPPQPLPAAARGEGRSLRPHQRHRLREIADVIIRQSEQHGIGARGDQIADQPRLCVFERERAGERGERVAAVGIFDLAKIVCEKPQLVVAAGLVGEAIEQFGEAVHASASSPRGTVSPSSSSP